MRMLLILIVLTVGGLAYFEFAGQQMAEQGFQHQMADLLSQSDSLTSRNQELRTAQKNLITQIKKVEEQIENINVALKKKASMPPPKPKPKPVKVAPKPAPPIDPTNLGNFTSLTGHFYKDCRVVNLEPDGVVVSSTDGITKILFTDLPPALRKQVSTLSPPPAQ